MNAFRHLTSTAWLYGSVAAFLLVSNTARATTLDLVSIPPDINATSLFTQYDSTLNQFSAEIYDNYSVSMKSGPLQYIVDGHFKLDAIIDNTGAFQSGTIAIYGTLTDNLIAPDSTFNETDDILKGTLTDFSYKVPDSTHAKLEFTFIVDGPGSLEPHIQNLQTQFGSTGGIILTIATETSNPFPFTGDYADNDAQGTANVFPTTSVPLPRSSLLCAPLIVGLILIQIWRTRRRIFSSVIANA